MDTALFLAQLPINLGDPSQTTYGASLCQTAMVLAVRAYRRWRLLLRPFGSGSLYKAQTSGQNTVLVVGGPFSAGQSVTITDQFGSETFTVLSMAAGTPIANWMGTPIQLTLSGNLASNHAAGVSISPSSPGLTLVAGQSLYPLPLDFVKFDQLTWDLANGTRSQVKQVESFYDGAYAYSQLLSGVGWGQAQTFNSGPGFGVGGPGFVGIPNAPATFVVPQGASNQTVIEVMAGNPPVLFFNPPPQTGQFWQFNYRASHQPETVPDEDFDAVMDAARLVATEARMQIQAGKIDWKDIDQERKNSPAAQNLMAVAEQAMKQFDLKIRKRPSFLMG